MAGIRRSPPLAAGNIEQLCVTTGGSDPVLLPNGEQRGFLEDGDEIILQACAEADGFVPIGFGECRAIILPAR